MVAVDIVCVEYHSFESKELTTIPWVKEEQIIISVEICIHQEINYKRPTLLN